MNDTFNIVEHLEDVRKPKVTPLHLWWWRFLKTKKKNLFTISLIPHFVEFLDVHDSMFPISSVLRPKFFTSWSPVWNLLPFFIWMLQHSPWGNIAVWFERWRALTLSWLLWVCGIWAWDRNSQHRHCVCRPTAHSTVEHFVHRHQGKLKTTKTHTFWKNEHLRWAPSTVSPHPSSPPPPTQSRV